jgi:hypothetical protein
MSMTRVEDLWTRYLAEGTLPSDEEQELLRALESDDSLRRRLIGDRQLDGLLDAVHAPDEDGRQFIRSFQDRLAVEGDETNFVAQVEEKIRRKPPRRAGPAAPPSALPLMLVAAAVLVVILLSVFVLSTEPPARVVKSREVPQIPEKTPDPAPVFVPAPEKQVVQPRTEEPKAPAPPPQPEPPPPPAPKSEPEPQPQPQPAPVQPERKTVVEAPKPVERAVAKLERVEGECRPDRAGDIAAGQGVETLGAKSAAVVVYPDATRLELGPQTAAREFADAGKGKTLFLENGSLAADVARQPQGQPMSIRTPHAEVRVLGTTLKITIDPTGAGSTRLDVLTGKVRLIRLSDGKAVDVVSGYYAVAGAGIDLVSRSSAPKPKVFLLQENFQDPRGVDARWKIVGTAAAIKTAGQLDIDLNPKSPGPNGWGGAGLMTRQSFAPSLAMTLDVDLPVLHPSVVAAVVFIPQGQKRGGDGVFRVQLRENRYTLTVESGEARDLASADRAGGAPCREKWRIELDGAAVRFLVDGREIFKHKHELQVPPGYTLGIDGSVRSDAPSGAKAAFDNVAIEPLK